MSEDGLTPREALEQKKARLLEAAAAKEAAAAADRAAAAAIDRDIAELERLAATYNLSVATHRSPANQIFDGSIPGLIGCYKTHPESQYKALRHGTRTSYDGLLRRIGNDCAADNVSDLSHRRLTAIHNEWKRSGIPMAHALVTMLRGLATFGDRILDDRACRELRMELHNWKVPNAKRNQVIGLNALQAANIIASAHEMGLHSIALAQAFQFDCKLGQRDVIGEWTPITEPGPPSDVIYREKKWLRGLRWSEIDRDKVLRHTLSQGGKPVVLRLSECPLVKAELARLGSALPQSGPVVVFERTELPYYDHQFRRNWREIATAAGIPSNVFNMDSRLRNAPDGPTNGEEDIDLSKESPSIRN